MLGNPGFDWQSVSKQGTTNGDVAPEATHTDDYQSR